MSKIVNRTLDVFEAFAERREPLLLTDLMKVLDIPLSSCHDMVRALEQRGYLYEVRHRSGYYPTARLLDVARAIVDHDPVSVRAAPVLERLKRDFDVHGIGSSLVYEEEEGAPQVCFVTAAAVVAAAVSVRCRCCFSLCASLLARPTLRFHRSRHPRKQ